jgi:asparagine synthase (glutamine-hydrolysing)
LDSTKRAGLAQRRLSIIDLAPTGHQPMVWQGATGEVVINFNGEIYNYRELRVECDAAAPSLLGEAIPWRGNSDTEVILWGYLLWGDAVFRLLDGMFAIAFWDGRTGRMLLVRDQFGVKPLYYSIDHERLIFASELKALSALGALDRGLDPVAIAQYISFLYTPGERTMFRSVKKLQPGAWLEVRANGERSIGYVSPPFPTGAVDYSLTVDTATARLRSLLDAAVRRQMVADVPVGAFLSGGLDSSSIVNFARAYSRPGKLQCFTIGHSGGSPSEEGWVADLPYAKRVAAHLEVDLHTVWVGPEMAEQFAWMVGQLDEPQADPAALNAFFICKLAREQGIKVLLSGAGGDDIFTGYRRHRALMLERWWAWMPVAVRKLARLSAERVGQNKAWGRRLGKAFQFADATPEQRMLGYFRWLPPSIASSLLSASALAEVAAEDPAQPMLAALGALPKNTHPLAKMLHLDSRYFLVDHNLNYSDKMSMAASVEVRVPFMDPALVAFAGSLPPHMKQRGASGKWIFKKAMEPFLPHDVIYRPKTGFGVPLRSWLKNQLRESVDDALSEATLRKRGIFDPAGVRRLLEMDRKGTIDATYSIFSLMCIETWCRKFVDG